MNCFRPDSACRCPFELGDCQGEWAFIYSVLNRDLQFFFPSGGLVMNW